MQFTREQIQEAMNCKSVDELLALAKDKGIDMNREEAEKYFAQLNGKELNPEDIESVAGGCVGNICGGNISAAC